MKNKSKHTKNKYFSYTKKRHLNTNFRPSKLIFSNDALKDLISMKSHMPRYKGNKEKNNIPDYITYIFFIACIVDIFSFISVLSGMLIDAPSIIDTCCIIFFISLFVTYITVSISNTYLNNQKE